MIREWLSHLHWSTLPIITMMMFISVFVGAVIWVYRKKSGEIYAQISRLPLEDNDTMEAQK